MTFFSRLAICVLLALSAGYGQKAPIPCSQCDAWNQPQAPFRIFGGTYYVGPHGLSSILITSSAGHVLIDGALPESARIIAKNIKSLGFRVEDVKVILNSHVHFDHAGGLAELQRLSGARVMASPWSAAVMRKGGVGKGDPQLGVVRGIAAIRNVHVLHDGEVVRVGDLAITMHLTAGHTPGGTSWTWKSCEGSVCHDLVYADSLRAISAPGFKYSRNHSFPDALADFEKSFSFLETVPCEILITPHPEISGLWDQLNARNAGASDAMVNASSCRELASRAREQLQRRLKEEQSGKAE